ncbi:MAG: tetratricopeptide repeat protein [Chitinivibrionales bacterium]|nr:tetratricopeptide repeat protein [Chitinivibrionales bacterium]
MQSLSRATRALCIPALVCLPLMVHAASSGSPTFIIARPSDASLNVDPQSKWFGALSEELFHFRFNALSKCKVVSRDKLFASLPDYRNILKDISQEDYFPLAKMTGAEYVIFQKYETFKGGQEILYLMETHRVKDKKVVSIVEKTLDGKYLGSELDSCILNILIETKTNLPKSERLFLGKPVVSASLKNLKRIGSLLITEHFTKTATPASIAPQYQRIADKDVTMFLALYLGAYAYEKAGKYADAAKMFESVIVHIPEAYPGLYAKAAKNFVQAKRYSEAMSVVKKAERKAISSHEIIAAKAEAYLAQGKRKAALPLMQKVIIVDKNNPAALLFFAQEENKVKRYSQALEFAERLLKLEPNNAEALLEKGRALKLLKRHKEALPALTQAITLLPENADAHLLLADIYAARNKHVQAAEHYLKAAEFKKKNLSVHLSASRSLKKIKKHDEALDFLRKAQSRFSGKRDFQLELGMLEYEYGDSSRAFQHLERYAASGARNLDVYLALGELYEREGKYLSGVAMYKKAMPMLKRKNPTKVKMARLYYKNNYFTKAIELLRPVSSLRSPLKESNYYLAGAYLAKRDTLKALRAFAREKRYHGYRPGMQRRMADLYYAKGVSSKAKTEYLGLVKAGKVPAEVYIRLSDMYLDEKNMAKAEEYLLMASQQGKMKPGAYCEFGASYASLKQYAKAIDAYNRCLQKKPRDKVALLKLAGLYERVKNHGSAAQIYKRIYELKPATNKNYLLKSAQLNEKAGQISRARTEYQEFISKGFKDATVSIKLATFAFREKKYQDVINYLRAITGKKVEARDVQLMLAESYLAEKAYGAAVAVLKKIVATQAGNAEIIEKTAVAAEKAGDLKTATSMYRKFLKLPKHPRQQEYAFHLGEILEQRNLHAAAVAQYKKNIANSPKDLKSYDRLIALYRARNDFSSVEPLLEKAVRIPGAQKEYAWMLAQTRLARKDTTGAIASLSAYVKSSSADTSALVLLGTLHFSRRNLNKAVVPLEQAAVLMPENFSCHYKLGRAYYLMKSAQKAIPPLKRAHELEPRDQKTMKMLSDCYRKLDDKHSLVEVLKDFVAVVPDSYRLLAELGHVQLELGFTDQALEILEKAIQHKTGDIKTRLLLANAYKKKGREDLWLNHVNMAHRHAPEDFTLNYELGKYHADKKMLDKAAHYFKKAVDVNAQHAQAQFEYGKILAIKRNFEPALKHLSLAAELDPAQTDYQVYLARTAFQDGSQQELALDAAKKALRLDAANAAVLFIAGALYKKEGVADSARLLLHQAAALNDGCASCHLELGELYFNQGEFEKAVEHFENTLDIDRKSEAATLNLGKTVLKLGKRDKAREYFETVLSINGANTEALYLLCHSYVQTGELATAKKIQGGSRRGKKDGWTFLLDAEIREADGDLKKALLSFASAARMMPHNAAALAGQGRIFMYRKKYSDAIRFLSQAYAYEPSNADYMTQLANVYFLTNNPDAAASIYEEAIRMDPLNVDAYYFQARMESNQGNHIKSIRIIKMGLEHNGKSSRLYAALGHEYRLSKLYDDAIDAWKKAVKFDEAEIEAYRYIGNVYYSALNKKGKARDFYEKYRKAGGDNDVVLKRLSELQ